MLGTILIQSADSMIGRFDHSLMSDQGRMELTFDGVNSADKIILRLCYASGEFLNFCSMTWVSCNEQGQITKARNPLFAAAGSITLDYLPPLIKDFSVSNLLRHDNRLTGTLETANLPAMLESFAARSQALSGSIDFWTLPLDIDTFDVSDNHFEGSCDLTALPPKMKYLMLSQNKFCGSVSLQSLPADFQNLYLNACQFHGPISLNNLPNRMNMLDISENAFSGEFALTSETPCLSVCAEGNAFVGTAVVGRRSATNVNLKRNRVVALVDDNGERYGSMVEGFALGKSESEGTVLSNVQ